MLLAGPSESRDGFNTSRLPLAIESQCGSFAPIFPHVGLDLNIPKKWASKRFRIFFLKDMEAYLERWHNYFKTVGIKKLSILIDAQLFVSY